MKFEELILDEIHIDKSVLLRTYNIEVPTGDTYADWWVWVNTKLFTGILEVRKAKLIFQKYVL